ncbi:reverse transcriptase domain-containing protein [Tanacetum coccineum]
MKKVVKKEVIKLLDSGIIYPIEDSPWVSSVHCVHKKRGMTVVTNERNELVPTRSVTGFSKISRPMTKLLEKDAVSYFMKECTKAFETLKDKLANAPIMISPDWSLPFELMCDASNFAVGAVLGQREGKHFRHIHFASKTLNNAQQNYMITEKNYLL